MRVRDETGGARGAGGLPDGDAPGDSRGGRSKPEPDVGSIERREFLSRAGRWAGGFVLCGALAAAAGCGADTCRPRNSAPSTTPSPAGGLPDLAVVTGADPGVTARGALDALGGMGRFVKPGDLVAVKVNASFMDGPAAATSTHPEVVRAVVEMCRRAGARRVVVMDHCLRGSRDACLDGNGIGAAASRAGAGLLVFDSSDTGHGIEAAIPGGVAMRSAGVYPEVLEADLVITVPRAKHHASAGLSLGMKNLIGVMTRMSSVHSHGLHQAVADLTALVRPGLSVVDASAILLDNGPGGPGTVHAANTVIAGGDVVAADSCACTLFGRNGADIGYVAAGAAAGLGEIDLNRVRIARG